MLTADVIRKTQRSIGDDNEILITKADIVDWINEAQTYITRETQYRTATTTGNASTFVNGVTISDLLLLKRIYYGARPLALIDVETRDRMGLAEVAAGTPYGYFMDGLSIFLFPTPTATDTTTVTTHYVDEPTALATFSSSLDLPAIYHEDIVLLCKMRANERNENYRAAEHFEKQFKEALAQRKYEGQSQDDSFHVVGPDYEDFNTGGYYDGVL